MSVKTRVSLNERIEYKYVDEYGRPISPLQQNSQLNISGVTQNETFLKNQNSQLLTQTQELKKEVDMLRAVLKG